MPYVLIIYGYPLGFIVWKGVHILASKHWKSNDNLSLSFNGVRCDLWEQINNGVSYSKAKFLRYVWFFFLFLCGCNCLDDGMKGAKNRNKMQDNWKAKCETFSSSNVLYGGFYNRWKCFLLV